MIEGPSDDLIAVLVVEDETLVRIVLTEMLGGGEFHVYDARDGQEALTILEVRGEAIRVLVTDIAMPNLNGLDLAEIVNRRWPDIGIVLSSGNPPADVRDKMPEGATFLGKPYKEEDLLEAVRAVANRPSPSA